MAIVQNNYWEANEGKDMGNEEKTQKKKQKKGEKKKHISKMAAKMGLGEGSVLAIKIVYLNPEVIFKE